MVFADGFWEIKTVVDVIAIVGLVLTLLSIWLSVYFARRDAQSSQRDGTRNSHWTGSLSRCCNANWAN